jgi:hypothetical protein
MGIFIDGHLSEEARKEDERMLRGDLEWATERYEYYPVEAYLTRPESSEASQNSDFTIQALGHTALKAS